MKKAGFVMLVIFTLTAIGYFLGATHAETKYLEKKDVTKTMIQWNKALGVKCSFCHTKDRSETYKNLAGRTVSEKELKALVYRRIARAMEGYTLYLNKKENKNYTCKTCHKGNKEVEIE